MVIILLLMFHLLGFGLDKLLIRSVLWGLLS